MKRKWIFSTVVISLVLASLACQVPDALINAEVPSVPGDALREEVDERTSGEPYVLVTPNQYCPGEQIRVEWSIGPVLVPCLSDESDPTCVTAFLSSPLFSVRSDDPRSVDGSEVILPNPQDFYGGVYSFQYILGSPHDDRSWLAGVDSASPLTDTHSASISQTFSLQCDPETSTWQWGEGYQGLGYGIEAGYDFPSSSCLGITQMCVTSRLDTSSRDIHVRTIDSQVRLYADAAGNQCWSSSYMNGYHPRDVEQIQIASPEYDSVVGQPCAAGDSPPIDLDGTPGSESFGISYSVACMDLSQLKGSAYEYCEDNWGSPGESIPPGGGGGGSPDEPGTCGPDPDDGVCCAAANETAETDPACGSAQEAGTLCSSPEQQGVQWRGTACTCEGIEINSAICRNGQQIVGGPTGNSCTPSDTCQPSGGDPGGEPGDVCRDAVCGDGDCDFPACEDSMSCPADCFG